MYPGGKRCIDDGIHTYPDRTQAIPLDHDIWAICQTLQSITCDIDIPAYNDISRTQLRLYFDPSKDGVDAQNMSIYARVTLRSGQSTSAPTKVFNPQQYFFLPPGTWSLLATPENNSCPEEWEWGTLEILKLYLRPRNFLAMPAHSAGL